jgi:alanyl-tRNA synthetase
MNTKITNRYYYKEPYLSFLKAKIIDIVDNKIILDKTIAFPEGGGQEGDRGVFIVNNKEIPFFDTKKGLGKMLYIDNFPTIQVNTPVYHFINNDNLKYFKVDQKVIMQIDTIRRAKLSISHSGIHLVLMCLEKIFPNYEKRIYGASIKEDGARLDFRTTEKFKPEQMLQIENDVNQLIQQQIPIKVYPHQDEAEAWYWQCQDYICACGGTHLDNTKYIGKVKIKRKNLGKNGQRVSFTYDSNSYFQGYYYEAKNIT